MFGLYEQTSAWPFIAALPVSAWEVSLAIWLIAKGFKPSPITSTSVAPVGVPAALPAA